MDLPMEIPKEPMKKGLIEKIDPLCTAKRVGLVS